MSKMFCSQTNYATDQVLKDSVDNFTTQQQTDSTTVTARDSIYKYESVGKVKYKDIDSYYNNGYGCECAK